MRKRTTHKAQFGRSMIEMLGVLAIIGVLSVGGLAGYRKAMRTIQLNEARQYFTKVQMEYKTQGVTGGLNSIAYQQPCVDFIGEPLPAGMKLCKVEPHYATGSLIYIIFNSGTLLLDFIDKNGFTCPAASRELLQNGKNAYLKSQFRNGRWNSSCYSSFD